MRLVFTDFINQGIEQADKLLLFTFRVRHE